MSADKNGNLELDKDEFVEYCYKLGIKDKKAVAKLFTVLDVDYSGDISLYEFCFALTS